jgi:cytochrome c-type biogenesis protein
MLLCYSLGLGIPFVISALLIDKLKSTFNFIKKNYKVINMISGILLIVIGVLMMTGMLTRFMAIFA